MIATAEFSKKILIVDDSEINRMILSEMLAEEFDLLEAEDGVQAIELLKQRKDEIGLILLDVVMPNLDGFGVLGEMKARQWTDDIQVIMISAEAAPLFMRRAYDLGAVDFISRPFDRSIVYRRIVNVIMLYARQNELTDMLTEQILHQERDNELMVSLLSHIVEFRNGESGTHVQNINIITELLLDRLLSKTDRYQEIAPDVSVIKMASSLHDIGKIGIPEPLLNKPGKLTPEEYEIMKTHTLLGAQTIQTLSQYREEALLKYSYQICRWHHERWDGRGYPDGLAGEDIPIAAQVVSLADVYDALTSERCYKTAFSHAKAMEMICGNECGVFNPLLLDCLRDIEDVLQGRSAQQRQLINSTELEAAAAKLTQHVILPKKSEETISQQQQQQQRAFFRHTGEPWLSYDNESDTMTFNAPAQALFGLPEPVFNNAAAVLRERCGEAGLTELMRCYYETEMDRPDFECDLEVGFPEGARKLHLCGSTLWSRFNDKPRQRSGMLLRVTDVQA